MIDGRRFFLRSAHQLARGAEARPDEGWPDGLKSEPLAGFSLVSRYCALKKSRIEKRVDRPGGASTPGRTTASAAKPCSASACTAQRLARMKSIVPPGRRVCTASGTVRAPAADQSSVQSAEQLRTALLLTSTAQNCREMRNH